MSLAPSTPEAASAGAELVAQDGRALPLVAARLVGEARGGLARLVLEQRFENRYAEHLHVTYRMPLPADGAVSGYEFELGDRVIRGQVDRRARARERFERAVASGHTAALLDQERADIFTQRLGNLPAGAALTARITIDQRLAWLPEGEWELRFPTVIGPRYIGSADTDLDVRATHVKVADRPLPVTVQIELTVRDAITGGGRPSSPSHALTALPGGAVALAAASRLDRDLVVRWPVAAPAVGATLACARPATGDRAYGLCTVVPPVATRRVAVPRDLLILLDTSGSMSGGPLDKAKQVVALLLGSLGERDRFELIEFSNEPRPYAAAPEAATPAGIARAIAWVTSRQASGGTEMRAAVLAALTPLRIGAQRQVVLVTDGYVGGEQQILDVLLHRLPASCRLHVLGVGSAVNRSLATALARAGRGAEVIVGIDEDAERGAKRLLDRTRQPVLTNVSFAGSALVEHAPAQVPDVFAGAPLTAALALAPGGGELVIRGQLADEAWEHVLVVPPVAAGEGNQAICALFGRERVGDLETHAATGAESGIDRAIEELGLRFQIATRLTSWVAIDESRVVAGPTREELVPQELPYGTAAESFGLRAAIAVPGGPPGGLAQPAGFAPADLRTRTGVLFGSTRAGSIGRRAQTEEEADDASAVPAQVRDVATGKVERKEAGEKWSAEVSAVKTVAPEPAPAEAPRGGAPVAHAVPPPPKTVALGAARPTERPEVRPTAPQPRRWWPLALALALVLGLIALLVWALA